MLTNQRDSALEAYLDRMTDREAAGVERRLPNPEEAVRVNGCFFETAVTRYGARAKRRILDTALEAIDTIKAAYGPGRERTSPATRASRSVSSRCTARPATHYIEFHASTGAARTTTHTSANTPATARMRRTVSRWSSRLSPSTTLSAAGYNEMKIGPNW
jgi:hypothetical protein